MSLKTEQTSNSVVRVVYWQPQGVQRNIAFSSRHFVGLTDDGATVLKYPHCKDEESMRSLREEAARYQHLGRHDHLVAFKRLDQNGVVLEYCAEGELEDVLRRQPAWLDDSAKQRIGEQVVRCLIHLHARHYIHADLCARNVFVTSAAHDAKVGDIQGQLYAPDGGATTVLLPAMTNENAKARHPEAGEDESSVWTDLFALGTLLYQLWHGQTPWPELSEYEYADGEEVQARFRRGEYPLAGEAAGMDAVIGRCWRSEYGSALEVLGDLRMVSSQMDLSRERG